MKTLAGFAAAATVAASLGLNVGPALAAGTDVSGQIIRSDVSWPASGGPYLISSAVQIAAGATLTIQSGAEVRGQGAKHLFKVAGDLVISGTGAAPVRIDAGGNSSLIEVASTALDATARISGARIANGKALLPPTGNGGKIQFRLENSTVRDMRAYNYVWYPLPGSTIAGNTFTRSGGFSIGMDSRPDGIPPIEVTGNRFRTKSTTGYWIENWAAYGAPLPVTGNSFEAAGETAVSLELGYSSAAINAEGNYWGTTNRRVIGSMILDGLDDIDYASIIPFEPFLSSAPTNSPTSPPVAQDPEPVTDGTISAAPEGYWPKPEGCGSYLVRYSGISSADIGTIDLVDAASGETLSTESFFAEDVGSGVYATQICSFEAQDIRNLQLVLNFGDSPVDGPVFQWGYGVVPSPSPQSLPGMASLESITVSTEGIWTAPDGCGNYLFRYSGITDDDIGTIRLIDPTTRDIVAFEGFLGAVGNGLGNLQICDFEMRPGQPLIWQLDFADRGLIEGQPFTWQSRPPSPPAPKSLPGRVSLGPIAVATTGDWSVPSGCRDYTFNYTGWGSDNVGAITLIDAITRDVIASEIFFGESSSGSGEFFICDFEVTASSRMLLQVDASGLGTAEGDVFTWKGATPSILITGSRTKIKGKPGILVTGSVSGLAQGTKLAPKFKLGKGKFRTLKPRITVDAEGEFTWKRKTKKKAVVILQTADGSVTSNRIRL